MSEQQEDADRVLFMYVNLNSTLTEYVRKGVTRVELDKLFVTIDKIHQDIKKEMTIEFNKNRGR